MADHKTKSFNFFTVQFNLEPSDYTLEELLIESMLDTKTRDRLVPLDKKKDIEESEYYGFIGHREPYKGFWCANFFSIDKDKVEHVVNETFDTEELLFTPVPPPEGEDGTKRQYIDGKMHFICTKNDLIIATDRRLSHRHLEKYINDIIHKRCDVPKEYEIRLIRPPSRKLFADIKNVKRINLSAPLRGEVEENHAPQTLEGNKYWNALKTYVGQYTDLTKFDTGRFIKEKNLRMDISLIFNKKRSEAYSDEFDSIANALRYAEEEIDYAIVTPSGTWTREKLTLRKPHSVEHIDDMPVNRDIFDKMAKWYLYLLKNGDI